MSFLEAFITVIGAITLSMFILILLALSTHLVLLIISAFTILGAPFLIGLAQIIILIFLATTIVYWVNK